MNIERLINLGKNQNMSVAVQPIGVQQASLIKRIMRKLFSTIGISLIKSSTLKKLDCLKAGMEYNAQFARIFFLERAGIDALYSSLIDESSKLSLDRYI